MNSVSLKKDSVPGIALTVFICIIVNLVGNDIARHFGWFLWADSFGTIYAAYALGPIPGAIVGCTGNFAYAFQRPVSAAYALTSLYMGLTVGYIVRKKHIRTLMQAMTLVGVVTLGSTIISTALNLCFFGGSVGNNWGDATMHFFMELGFPMPLSSLIGQFYLEFTDKFTTILILFFLIRWYRLRRIRKRRAASRINSLLAIAAVIPLSLIPAVRAEAAAISGNGAYDRVSYIQTLYSSDNGLPCGHANDVAQTKDGILWIGTYAGLYRFNGLEFRSMNDYEDVKNVNCLYVDEEGRLWIGTNDNGLVMSIHENVSNVMNMESGLPSNSIRSVTQSSDGEYYVGTSNGLAVLQMRMGLQIKKVIPEIGFATGTDADRDGNVAVADSVGNLYILRKGAIVTSTSAPAGLGKINSCAFRDDGRILAGTTEGNILVYTLKSGKLIYERPIYCGGLTTINRIFSRNNGEIWVCADNGIGYLPKGGSFIRQETGTFNYSIWNMDEDYQGNLWFASSRMGLLRLTESSFTDIFAEAGLTPAVVNSSALWQGLLYTGTDKGLSIVDMEHGGYIEDELTEYLDNTRVRCVMKASGGSLFISSYGKGLIEVEPSGEFHAYNAEEDGLGDIVRMSMELSDGSVAVSGDRGVSFIRNGKAEETIPYGEELGSAKALCFRELSDGTLLIGTDGNGIALMKDRKVTGWIKAGKGELSSGVILRMVPDIEEDKTFIVTSNGISYVDGSKVTNFTHFPYSNNYDIVLDEDGEMFVLGSAGVYTLKRQDILESENFDYTILNSKLGLMGSLTANAWNELTEDKDLYISTDRGVYMVNLDRYRKDRNSYRLMLKGAKLDENPVPVERGMDIVVGRDVNRVEFIPEIVNYTLENPTVAYYLEGLDSEWKTVNQNELSSVVYTNLSPKDYVFHLAIMNRENGSILEESTYRLTKQKAMYDQGGFIVYLVGVGCVFLGWLTWFLTRTQVERTIELQKHQIALAQQQAQMGNETILAIAKTVDAKDERTSKHSQRVSEYSVLIAKEYGFSEKEQENLRRAALLHDIGKIAIPDSILNKPARLDDDEYAVMKTHVTRGAEILKDFTLIEHVVEGARYHHERYDGKGYPDRLKDTNIPLYGRIIAIADAFDAMTANRVYRKKQDFDYVLSELKKGRGSQFDPELVDIFLSLIDRGIIDIGALYKDDEKGQGEDHG